MMLTTKTRYAVTAILYIAGNQENITMSVDKIAKNLNLNASYLEQILIKLKKKNIITSVKGPGGGYLMQKKPNEISLAIIFEAVGESIKMTRCGQNKPGCMRTEHQKCATHNLWAGLTKQIADYINTITIADVLQGNINFS